MGTKERFPPENYKSYFSAGRGAISLITLPVEFDASRRAKLMLSNSGHFIQEEMQGVSAVLNAAALIYVASFLSALLSLLRLALLAQRRRR